MQIDINKGDEAEEDMMRRNAGLYNALKKIEALLITRPWTEREAKIYSIACAALNLADGTRAIAEDAEDENPDETRTLLPRMRSANDFTPAPA